MQMRISRAVSIRKLNFLARPFFFSSESNQTLMVCQNPQLPVWIIDLILAGCLQQQGWLN